MSTPRRITCPDCGRPNVALTTTGRIYRHNHPEATAEAKKLSTLPWTRVVCDSYLLTPGYVATVVSEQLGMVK